MDVSDWAAVIALGLSGAALSLEVKRWIESGPRLQLTVMPDMVTAPHDDGRPKLALTVINQGSAPTTLTHMVGYVYPTICTRMLRKPTKAFIVNTWDSPFGATLPHELGVNRIWTGVLRYDDALSEKRARGELYVGVFASHARKPRIVRVDFKPDPALKDMQNSDDGSENGNTGSAGA